MSTLYIRLPSQAAADGAPDWMAVACPFALVSHGDVIERDGVAVLADLSDAIKKVQRVVLLLAAADVTLLQVQAPPLSAAKLRAALPHLVEDQLITDPTECVMVISQPVDGLRTVAVVYRAWFERLIQSMQMLGAHHVVAFPAQLCLPYEAGVVSARVGDVVAVIDVGLRSSEHIGIGLSILPESHTTARAEVLQTIAALAPEEAPIALAVPSSEVPIYQATLKTMPVLDQRITVFSDAWSRWIAGASQTSLNLIAGSGMLTGRSGPWRAWRWPLAVAAAVLLVNVVSLNVTWWRMKREAGALRAAMVQTYQAAYPKDTVIVDPVAQMRQKIAAAQHDAGQAAPDDFIALLANFSQAWETSLPDPKLGASLIAGLEYRDRSLLVRLREGAAAPLDPMKVALAARNLSLSQPTQGLWQIRSMK